MVLALLLSGLAGLPTVLTSDPLMAVPAPCGQTVTTDRTTLLREEERATFGVRDRRNDPTAWLALACLRAQLEAARVPGRQGIEMGSGEPWALGSIRAAGRAVRLDVRSRAVEVLAEMMLGELADDVPESMLGLLVSAVDAGGRAPALLRACAEHALARGREGTARQCAQLGLAAGSDSTFHLLRVARLSYRAKDRTSGERAFLQSALSMRGPLARAELTWHLQWFLAPEEFEQWGGIPDSTAGAWVRNQLAVRDVRDGRAAGSRLAEHFARLEYVTKHFVLRLPRHVRLAGGLVGATPESGGGENPDLVAAACEPGEIPAAPFRFYQRWQQSIDDRGAVWLRYGAPMQRIRNRPTCAPGNSGPPPNSPNGVRRDNMPIVVGRSDVTERDANIREAWKYVIDGRVLLLHFENERFDGSSEATRLVAGVLGTYLCDVDAARCNDTERSKMANRTPALDDRLSPERIVLLRQADQEAIVTATTRDDNAVRTKRNIPLVASQYRLWDPRTREPITLVTWAVPLADVSRDRNGQRQLGTLRIEARRWSSASGTWLDTAFVRQPQPKDTLAGRRFLAGSLALPGGDDATAWGVTVSQEDGGWGRSWEDDAAPLGRGSTVLSDIVLGIPGEGLEWRAGVEPVPLAPFGALVRGQPGSLYLQVRSTEARSEATMQVQIYRDRSGAAPAGTSALEIAFPVSLRSGVNEFARQVDFQQLEAGRYRLQVQLVGAGGRVLAVQSRRFSLQ
ncbi:MAG: hypothetical protein KA267_10120 [Gemmatimonadales bacterium]|nr:hypothetical protein [Gemmatimonadales bacterium]MBP7621015.1 hypothetical protein [Gemmatimonadales bacterium]